MRIHMLVLCLLLGCSPGDLTLPGEPRPVTLRVLDGDEQRAQPGDLLEEPLVVQALDADARPVTGSTVEFRFLGDLPGAGLDPATAVTDAEGRAAAVVRLGSVSGEQTIVARVAGTSDPDLTALFTAVASGDDRDDDGRKGRGGKHGEDEDDD